MKIKSYRIYYVVALLIIASMTILSHVLIGFLLKTNNGFAYLINESGRQRMLSQRVASYSMQYYIKESSHTREELNKTLAMLVSAHKMLSAQSSDKNENRFDMRMRHLYFQSDVAVDQDIKTLSSYVNNLLASTSTKAEQLVQINNINKLVNFRLLSALNEVVYEYQKESERRIQNLDNVQWVLLAMILLALVLEAQFIFRPVFIKLSTYVELLLRVSTTDELSGLCNRRDFDKKFAEQIDLAERFSQVCALAVIDVDNFKSINDHFGHSVGDNVITEIGKTLKRSARVTDHCFRIGGDEFVILLPHTDITASLNVINRFRAALRIVNWDEYGAELSVSVSIGVSSIKKGVSKKALEQADQSMYSAKKAGGDRLVLYAKD